MSGHARWLGRVLSGLVICFCCSKGAIKRCLACCHGNDGPDRLWLVAKRWRESLGPITGPARLYCDPAHLDPRRDEADGYLGGAMGPRNLRSADGCSATRC